MLQRYGAWLPYGNQSWVVEDYLYDNMIVDVCESSDEAYELAFRLNQSHSNGTLPSDIFDLPLYIRKLKNSIREEKEER